MRRVLYDTDVLLDFLLRRGPFFAESARALQKMDSGDAEGYVAAHAVTTIHYMLRKQIGTQASLAAITRLVSGMKIAPVTESAIRSALSAPLRDFEDTVTHQAAAEAGVDVIVTRNVRDYAGSTIPVMTPAAFASS